MAVLVPLHAARPHAQQALLVDESQGQKKALTPGTGTGT
jgi:hypothetical protein